MEIKLISDTGEIRFQSGGVFTWSESPGFIGDNVPDDWGLMMFLNDSGLILNI
jgi:hypothetical protein